LRFIGEDELDGPSGLCLDQQDNVYVGDSTSIQVFDGDSGEKIHSFGEVDIGPCYGEYFDSNTQKFWMVKSREHKILCF